MNNKQSDRIVEFEFDQWMELAQKDPENFEKKRQALIKSAISQAPEKMRQRLNGLQWSIDAKLKTSKNPMDGCLKIYQMMMNSVYGPGGLLNALSMEKKEYQVNSEKGKSKNVISHVFEIKQQK